VAATAGIPPCPPAPSLQLGDVPAGKIFVYKFTVPELPIYLHPSRDDGMWAGRGRARVLTASSKASHSFRGRKKQGIQYSFVTPAKAGVQSANGEKYPWMPGLS